ncbi:MAG: phenazine biosynthesis protein PhzF, partial [Naasia sp.]
SLNASIAQWLIGEGRAPSAYRAAQGSRVGRAGRVDVSSDEDGAVWVGGAAAVLIRGRVVV